MDKNYIRMYCLMEMLKEQSTCLDKQVVCIITSLDFSILSIGVNKVFYCDRNCDDKENRKCEVIHAEMIASFNLHNEDYNPPPYYAFVNLFPCAPCQKTLESKGIRKIVSFTPKHKEQVFKNIEIVDNLSTMLLEQNKRDKQLSVTQGELCELVTTISDYFFRREPPAPKNIPIENILDEIVDAELMITQLKKILWMEDHDMYNKLREVKENKYLKLLRAVNCSMDSKIKR